MTPPTNNFHLEISSQEAGTLAGLFQQRVALTPEKEAYRQFNPETERWEGFSWAQMMRAVTRYQAAMLAEGLEPGDRVAIMMNNRREWVMADQAALALGLSVVPLFFNDRALNAQYVLDHSGSKLLFITGHEQWDGLAGLLDDIPALTRVVSIDPLESDDSRLLHIDRWLASGKADHDYQLVDIDPNALATICYTSGTTGYPKGVMLSHANIMENARGSLQCGPLDGEATVLSFLPLSHMFERAVGYYMTMANGALVVYAQSVQTLADDLQVVRPTHMIAVPRIFERVYAKIMDGLQEKSPVARTLFKLAVDVGWKKFEHDQGRGPWSPMLLLNPVLFRLVGAKVMAKLGGRLELAISGGAALPANVGKLFISLGLPIIEGYGMTEHAPVISANRLHSNVPGSVGHPLDSVEVRLGDNNELLARSASVMLGYWRNAEASANTIDSDGWLHTGDQAAIDETGRIRITGRLKEIIVLANGEKIPPGDIEQAVGADPLIDQVLVVGEGKPYLGMLAVPSADAWPDFLKDVAANPHAPTREDLHKAIEALQERVDACMQHFPGYARVRKISLSPESWTIENGLMTPTLKLKRAKILEKHRDLIESMYRK